jgi:hypothetical protein
VAELAPQWLHPLSNRTISDHWQELSRQPHEHERLALDLNDARLTPG